MFFDYKRHLGCSTAPQTKQLATRKNRLCNLNPHLLLVFIWIQSDFCFLNYSRSKNSKNVKLLDFVGIAILLKIQKVLVNYRYPT